MEEGYDFEFLSLEDGFVLKVLGGVSMIFVGDN